MAEDELDIDSETARILATISGGKHFLLSGGAGSGKTYTLVETIKTILARSPRSSIACITYTNAAAREIDDRVSHPNLRVSTIHDFLWNNIKNYQTELKLGILRLVENEQPEFKNFKYTGENSELKALIEQPSCRIQYKEYVRFKDGIISHDELILLACHMYATYPKLCDITKDSFPHIFVDEYQDTAPSVVQILLDHMSQTSKAYVIGFLEILCRLSMTTA